MKFIKKVLTFLSELYLRFRLDSFSLGSRTFITGWRVRGVKKIKLRIDEDCIVTANICFEKAGAELLVGKRTFIGKSMISVANRVDIGNDVMISWGVTIADHNSHSVSFSERTMDVIDWASGNKNWDNVKVDTVKICNKSWIGFNSIILKGVSIGEGAIVGAGSVVTRDVSPWTIVAGNPAKVVRELSPDER